MCHSNHNKCPNGPRSKHVSSTSPSDVGPTCCLLSITGNKSQAPLQTGLSLMSPKGGFFFRVFLCFCKSGWPSGITRQAHVPISTSECMGSCPIWGGQLWLIVSSLTGFINLKIAGTTVVYRAEELNSKSSVHLPVVGIRAPVMALS